MIDWLSQETQLFLNPNAPPPLLSSYKRLYEKAPQLPGHVWLATSGSSGDLKLVALSKEALLTSAKAVNDHLQSTMADRWFLALPTFHVGGLGILARSFLSGAAVVRLPQWEPQSFCLSLHKERATLTSLVPAQVFDLVKNRCTAPSWLRACIVGGGALSSYLYQEGRKLGWNLLPSYGLTECGSQVATAHLDSLKTLHVPQLAILKHVHVGITEHGFLKFKGASLFSGCMWKTAEGSSRYCDPKVDGWFTSDDQGSVDGNFLTFYGRAGEVVKIGGENVDLQRVGNILNDARLKCSLQGDAVLLPVPDERLGTVLHAVFSGMTAEEGGRLMTSYNQLVFPFERVRVSHPLRTLPRSPLGKILKAELLNIILTRTSTAVGGKE